MIGGLYSRICISNLLSLVCKRAFLQSYLLKMKIQNFMNISKVHIFNFVQCNSIIEISMWKWNLKYIYTKSYTKIILVYNEWYIYEPIEIWATDAKWDGLFKSAVDFWVTLCYIAYTMKKVIGFTKANLKIVLRKESHLRSIWEISISNLIHKFSCYCL